MSLARAAGAITDTLNQQRICGAVFGGTVAAQRLGSRDAVRFEHQPSGFAAEYDSLRDLRDITVCFTKDLIRHLMRAETEAIEVFQEPHLVRL